MPPNSLYRTALHGIISGMRRRTTRLINADKFRDLLAETRLSYAAFAELAGLSARTVRNATEGGRVNLATAAGLAHGLTAAGVTAAPDDFSQVIKTPYAEHGNGRPPNESGTGRVGAPERPSRTCPA